MGEEASEEPRTTAIETSIRRDDVGVGAGKDEKEEDDGVGEEAEGKETARKVHPRPKAS